MKSVSAQAINFNYDGKNHLVPVEGVPLSSLNLNEYLMYRKYYAEGINFDLSSMTEYVDAIAAKSTGAEKYWAVGFTHRVSPDATSGNLSWDKFKYLMDYIAANYGRDGADNIWMTSYQEAYEYAEVYQGVSLQTSLSGDTLTISFDTSTLPGDLRYYALSLLVSADQEIRSVDYGLGDFTATSANLDSGLINLDWGFFLDQDEYTRSEEEVSKAEVSRISNDRDKAQSYVNVLPDGQRKNILQNRIDNIAVLGKTWRINFGLNSYIVGTWNIYGGDKSPYNKLLENLVDTDGNVSSLSVQVVQDFTSKFLNKGMNTGNNSGVIPDAYLQTGLSMYASTQQTGIVRFGGLDPAKKYDVFIVGSYNIASSSKSISLYTIKGETKELNIAQNTANGVTFHEISPEPNGSLDVAVSAKDSYFGYGVLNAVEIRERSQNKPSALINSITLRANSGLVDLNYSLIHDDADPIDLEYLQYSITGFFTGEELTALSASDPQNNGISNLASSITGTNHCFVWDARTDLGEFEGEAYLRFQPRGIHQSGAFIQTDAINLDFKAPIFSNLTISSSENSAEFSWHTHEDAYSRLDYGLSSAYGLSVGSLDSGYFFRDPDYSLGGLHACAAYHYRLLGRDAANNERQSDDAYFLTDGCLGGQKPVSILESSFSSSESKDLSLDGLRLLLPSNAISGSPILQIFRLDANSAIASAPLPESSHLLGDKIFSLNAYSSLSTKQSQLGGSATIIISYDQVDIFGLDPSTLRIAYWNGSAWDNLSDCSVNQSEREVSCTTDHFSDFALLGDESIPGEPLLLSPNGAGVIVSGSSTQQILWQIPDDDDLSHFDLEYSSDNGASWMGLVSGLASTTDTYSWFVPPLNTAEALLKVTVYDLDLHSSSSQSSVAFVIDTTNPTVTTPNLGAINIATAAGATAADTNGIASYSWTKVSGPGTITFSASSNILNPTIAASTDGSYSAQLTVVDNAGNTNNSIITFIWDTTAPSITIAPIFLDPTGDTTPIFTGTTTDALINISVVEYQVDGGPWTACSATDGAFNSLSENYTCTVASSLSDGLHTVYVRASDTLGNTSDGSVSDSFTVDLSGDEGEVLDGGDSDEDEDDKDVQSVTAGTPINISPPQTPAGGFIKNGLSGLNGTFSYFLKQNVKTFDLELQAGDDVDRYSLSVDPEFKNASIFPYFSPLRLDICSFFENCHDGIYTLYLRFYTRNGIASDNIRLDIDYRGGDEVKLEEENDKKDKISPGILAKRLAGRILLQVESRGEAWYVSPEDYHRYYLRDGNAAYELMRKMGRGITNKNLERLRREADFARRFKGYIFLQVESHGEAWYLDDDLNLHYLRDGNAAYELMTSLGLGITNKDLELIP